MENTTTTPVTHWKKLTNPNYIGVEILQPGQELKLTIEKIGKEQVKTADGTQECIVAHFKGGQKGMILNKTNCKIISTILDTPYIENWLGKSIIIYSAKVKAFGGMVDGLRVKNQKA